MEVQNGLGDRFGRDVFMCSITLDSENDNPAKLKDYAKSHRAKWTFLTGKAESIEKVRRALGLVNSDPKKDADRKNHTGLIKIVNEATGKKMVMPVLASPQRILDMIERVASTAPKE